MLGDQKLERGDLRWHQLHVLVNFVTWLMETFPCKILIKLLSKFIAGLRGAMPTFITSDPLVNDPGPEGPLVQY